MSHPLIDAAQLSLSLCHHPIRAELKYATRENFTGRIVAGYSEKITDVVLLTPKAAHAVCAAQNALNQQGYGLLVYDAYRPRRAVEDFLTWCQQPVADQHELERKQIQYPNIPKQELFSRGYLAEDSNHCYGNTVDLMLIDLATQQALDMGAVFDYLDELSHLTTSAAQIGKSAFQLRQLLQHAMLAQGFEPYENEFWHFCHDGVAGREVKEALDITFNVTLMRGIKEIKQ